MPEPNEAVLPMQRRVVGANDAEDVVQTVIIEGVGKTTSIRSEPAARRVAAHEPPARARSRPAQAKDSGRQP